MNKSIKILSLLLAFMLLSVHLISCEDRQTTSSTTLPTTTYLDFAHGNIPDGEYSLKNINGHLYLVFNDPAAYRYYIDYPMQEDKWGSFASPADAVKRLSKKELNDSEKCMLKSCFDYDDIGFIMDVYYDLYDIILPIPSAYRTEFAPTKSSHHYAHYFSDEQTEFSKVVAMYFYEEEMLRDFCRRRWINYDDLKDIKAENESKSISVGFFYDGFKIVGKEKDKYFYFEVFYQEEHRGSNDDYYQHLQNIIADTGSTVEEWLLSFGFKKYDVPEGLLP